MAKVRLPLTAHCSRLLYVGKITKRASLGNFLSLEGSAWWFQSPLPPVAPSQIAFPCRTPTTFLSVERHTAQNRGRSNFRYPRTFQGLRPLFSISFSRVR